MAYKGILSKNYYIDPETVSNFGAEVYNMMAEADQAMTEASEVIAKIASLTEMVPNQIRCVALLEACDTAQAEIKSVDFFSYGQKVNQGLQNLLDHNQYITEYFIKNMEKHTAKMRGLGEEFRRLADSITYADSESAPLKGIALSAVGNVENENTDVEEENLLNQGKEKENETNLYFLNDYFDSGEEFSEKEILRILKGGLHSGDITQNEYNNLKRLFIKMFNTSDKFERGIIYNVIKMEYNMIMLRNQNIQMQNDEASIYLLNDYFDSGQEFSEEEIFRILDGAQLSADITQEESDNLKELFTEMFILKNETIADETKIQSLYEEIEKEYNRIIERNQYIQRYINEDFLRNMGFDFEALGIDNFVVELKSGMIQYGITGEASIHMFLSTCMAETGGTDLLEIYNHNGDAGSGLIQVTGDAQYHFLVEIQKRYEEGSEEYQLIKDLLSGFQFEYDEYGYITEYEGYKQPADITISPSEYIAEKYPVESAVWFWGEYGEKCIIYYDTDDISLGCNTCTINQYVEKYFNSCEGREEDLFLATQYYVNGASLKALYLQQLCKGFCDENQNRYCITYLADGEEVDLEIIKEAARNNDDSIISELKIEEVAYQDVVRNAPIGCVARLWYYYRFLSIQGEIG